MEPSVRTQRLPASDAVRADAEEYLDYQDHSIQETGSRGFQQEVTNGFKVRYGCVYHTHDSRNSPAGYPDTIVVARSWEGLLRGKPPLIVIELKVAERKPSPEQLMWLKAFKGAGAMTFVLWPRHRPVLNKLYDGDFNHPSVQERLHIYVKQLQKAS